MLTFHLDAGLPVTPFPHYWENCVGSCHAYTALREDYRTQLEKAHRELGFRYVRFHGLLNDDMCVAVRNKQGQLVFNFFNVDCIFDYLLRIGMKPFIELGFMPTALASQDVTCFHYRGNVSKPKDYREWDELITRLTAHLTERYGHDEVASWYFEVWNEPNLKFFYAGTQEDYFELYRHTALAIKGVRSDYRVGGPATAINAWIKDLIAFCEKTATPLDFLSSHHYPTDDPLWNSGMSLEAYFEMMAREHPGEPAQLFHRGVLTRMLKRAVEEAGRYPLHYTEWNTSAITPDALHDQPYAAALIAKTLIDNAGLVETYSFWTFTDIFEDGSQLPCEFHGGFGLQTVHGVAKPSYRLFSCFHRLGDQFYTPFEEQGTVGGVATSTNDGLRILLYNHNIPDEEIGEEEICLTVDRFPIHEAQMERIDDAHANATEAWQNMGAPEYPSAAQLETLNAASELRAETLAISGNELRFRLPPHGVAMLTLR